LTWHAFKKHSGNWKDSGCKFYGAKGKRYKLLWIGSEDRSDSVGIFVAEKWVDSVVKC